MTWILKILSWLLLLPIYFYQHCISPFTPPSCRFTPTCSQYAKEAILKHGPFKGLYLAVRRILRCHPWGGSGFDPVPCLLYFCLLVAPTAVGCRYIEKPVADTTVLQQWQAGQTVSDEAIRAFGGVEKCFAAQPIPDAIWTRMQGKTYKPNPYIGRDDLRYVRLLHWDYDQQVHLGEMICNKRIADTVVRIFRQLYEARYPIGQMLLPDVYNADDETQMRHNNTSCFCYRAVAGSAKLSKHARGLAIDVNPLYNPYYKNRADGTRYVQPATAVKYCDRTKDFRYKIDTNDLCYRLFIEAGFEWGGAWKSCKDFQHFELSHINF